MCAVITDGSAVLRGCVFDGAITGADTTHCGGFVGYARNSISITDSVFAPSAFEPTQSQNFTRKTSDCAVSIENSYYLNDAPNDSQGLRGYAVTAGEGVTLDFGSPTAAYDVSGVTAYATGLVYGGAFRAGEGETVTLALSGEAPEGFTVSGYTAGAGALVPADGAWTLTVPGEDALISAVLVPAFGEPTFTLPAALTTIEQSAFEGMTAMTVVDASHCATIGRWAFRGCTGLTQIRLPADCLIDESAFDGCGTVYVFAPAGGATEDFCQSNDNPCVFVEEAQN